MNYSCPASLTRSVTLHLLVGVNLLVTPSLLSRLPQVLAQLRTQGVRHVTILRPKPPAFSTKASEAWYDAHRLRRAALLTLGAACAPFGPMDG